jgi:hypothetical protein
LRNFQCGSDVDNTGIALGIDEFKDAFEIILDRGRGGRL